MLVVDGMGVFFNADFCADWVRLVGADCAAVHFPAIYGVQDVQALQGYALSADCELSYITEDVDLHEGQLLQESGKTLVWRVRKEPERTADGMTSTVLIGRAPT